jgi:tripartite-type tricarboxylate transporter receptor subunit TctC
VRFTPVKDFVPITRVGSFTLMLVVNPDLPIHSVKEMIDYAKANPGNLTFATDLADIPTGSAHCPLSR